MYQQINLYQPVFRQQRKIFSAKILLQILVAVTLLMFGIYANALWTVASLDQTATSIEQQYQQLRTQLGNIEIIEQSSTEPLQADEIVQLQQKILQQQSLLDSIGQLFVKSATGFSDFFETLARQTRPGLWLSGVRLSEDGETELQGTTLDPQLIPDYLQQMPDLPRFRSLKQGSVHMVRNEQAKAEIKFVLRSKSMEEMRP